MAHNVEALLAGIEFKKLKLKQMTKKELLYKKLGALRLEVDSSIVNDIVATANDAFQEQYLQQCNVSGALPLFEQFVSSDEKVNGKQTEFIEDGAGGSEKYFSWSVIERWFRRQ